MSESVGTFVKLWTTDREVWGLVPDDEPRIDAAVSLWIDSGETRDTLLLLTLTGGDPFKVRASMIASWMLSTSHGRRREMEFSKAGDDEQRAVRRAIGDWEE
jgi:hypothetical protein